jgi:hypothetical protein
VIRQHVFELHLALDDYRGAASGFGSIQSLKSAVSVEETRQLPHKHGQGQSSQMQPSAQMQTEGASHEDLDQHRDTIWPAMRLCHS